MKRPVTGAVNVPADSSWVLECTAGLSNKSIIRKKQSRKIKERVTKLARWFRQGSQGSTVLCGFSSVSGDSLCRCPRDGLLAPFPVKTNLELKLSMWVLRISSTVPPRLEIFHVGFTDQLEGPPTPQTRYQQLEFLTV